MARKTKKLEGDTFRPKGQRAKDIELALASPREVIDVLGPRIAENRRKLIDSVVSHRSRGLSVAVEGLSDPHNTAAVIRTSDAFGIQNLHIIEGENKFKSSRNVTQGAHKWVDLSIWSTAEIFCRGIRENNRETQILVADMDGAIDLYDIDLSKPKVLVFGNEGCGISPQMREAADGAFRVPMYGFVESLNISVAAAISIAALRKGGRSDLTQNEQDELKARFYLRSVRAGYDIVLLERERAHKKK